MRPLPGSLPYGLDNYGLIKTNGSPRFDAGFVLPGGFGQAERPLYVGRMSAAVQGTAGSPAQPRNTAPKGVSPTTVTAAPRCVAG